MFYITTALVCASGLHWYMTVSDRGPDQVMCRKLFYIATASLPSVIFCDADCLMHAGHLIVQHGLKLIDAILKLLGVRWRYFSSLAIISNCWREKAKDIMDVWAAVYGYTDAVTHAAKLVPKVSAARWGSVEYIEACYLRVGVDKIHNVFRRAFARHDMRATTLFPDMDHAVRSGYTPHPRPPFGRRLPKSCSGVASRRHVRELPPG